MTLYLWNYEEIGERMEPHYGEIRFGRRQNALMCTRTTTNLLTNGRLNRDANGWLLAYPDYTERYSIDARAPLGLKPLEIRPLSAGQNSLRIYQNVTLPAAPDGVTPLKLSVYAKGAIGDRLVLDIEHPASGASPKTNKRETFTITHEGWQRYWLEVTPAAHSNSVAVPAFGPMQDNKYPTQFCAAMLTWGQDYRTPWVDINEGTVTGKGNAWQAAAAGGTALPTRVRADIPRNLLTPKGSIAFWFYHEDTLTTREEYICSFTRKRGTATRSMSLSFLGSQVRVLTHWQGVQTDKRFGPQANVQGEWHHYVVAWNDRHWRVYRDGLLWGEDMLGGQVAIPSEMLILANDTELGQSFQALGLLEGFTLYDRPLSAAHAKKLYERGDNMCTGAVLHAGFWDRRTNIELGRCVSFDGIGDYQVRQGGYGPGSYGQTQTVRFDTGRGGTGPYIAADRFGDVVTETIRFNITNTDTPTVSLAQKIDHLKSVLKTDSAGKRLVLGNVPLRTNRNLRATVFTSKDNIPESFTGPAQNNNVLEDLSIDLQREPAFSGARRKWANLFLLAPGNSGQTAFDQTGAYILPSVEGNVPAKTAIEVNTNPPSFLFSVRRRKQTRAPLYVINHTQEPNLWGSGNNSDAVQVSEPSVIGGTARKWTQTTIQPGYVQLGSFTFGDEAFDLRQNFGEYRLFAVTKISADNTAVDLVVDVGEFRTQQRIPFLPTGQYPLLDLGVVNVPGRSIERPVSNWWRDVDVTVGTQRSTTGGTFAFYFNALIFVPVDDGFASVYCDTNTNVEATFISPQGDIAQRSMISGYAGGLELAHDALNELRYVSLMYAPDSNGLPCYYYNAGQTLASTIEYTPQYDGVGDET